MFKAIIPEDTVLANGVNIPLTVKLSTNRDTRYNSSTNVVEILNPGYYDLKVSLPLTNASVDQLNVRVFANDVLIPEAISAFDITATTGVSTFTILDVLRIIPNQTSSALANISIRLGGGTADLAADGVFILERRK